MKVEELKDKSNEELHAMINELKEQTFRLRFKLALGNVDTVKQIRASRKDLARVLTLLRERELAPGK